jgi:hypothetical protein
MPSPSAADALPDDPADVHAWYDHARLDDLSDARLFDLAASAVAVPKRHAADSFALHAPLELSARRLFLPLVAPSHRRAVRERILETAVHYGTAAAPAPTPPIREFDSFPDAREELREAIALRDLARVDATASWIVDTATFDQIATLSGSMLDMLGAAGHAPIALFLAGRLSGASRAPLRLLRPSLVELAREAELRLHWVHELRTGIGDGRKFASALTGTPRLGIPGSDFVYPIIRQVDESGVAREVIEPTLPANPAAAASAILRVAAQSMLQDDPAFAPYGWTHCLTIPHAIIEMLPWLPEKRCALATAATYVVGFRAALARDVIDVDWVPERTSVDPTAALERGPEVARSAWYHASDATIASALPELVGRAAQHHDAHVVKYTYACLVAADLDPEARALYLAAAASLLAWWLA